MRYLRRFSPLFRRPEPEATPIPLANRGLVRRLEINSRRRLAASLAGAYRSQFRGQGMEFSELRPYQPGDDVRTIDWNVTARTGVPHVRQYREERSRSLTLLVDLSASFAGAKRDLLFETTGLLAFAAANSGDRVSLVAFTDRIEHLILPETGVRHARRILAELIAHRPQGRCTDLSPPIEAALQLNRRPGIIILLSDLHAPLPLKRLSEAHSRHDLVVLIPRDPQEILPQTKGLWRVADRETLTEKIVDLSSEARRKTYATQWEYGDSELTEQLQTLTIDYAFLNAGESVLPTLLRLFRRRSGRRR